MAKQRAQKNKKPPASMSMIDPRFRNIYLKFYKESYYTPTALDLKTKELIAIGASAIAQCEGCLQGHIRKAVELGVTRDEISDALVVAIGVAAASVMDIADRAAIRLDLHHFEDQ
ncbi:MAG: carboxymuconolactone decarboxylase family protein [Terriglobia bacterium]